MKQATMALCLAIAAALTMITPIAQAAQHLTNDLIFIKFKTQFCSEYYTRSAYQLEQCQQSQSFSQLKKVFDRDVKKCQTSLNADAMELYAMGSSAEEANSYIRAASRECVELFKDEPVSRMTAFYNRERKTSAGGSSDVGTGSGVEFLSDPTAAAQ